MHSRVLRILLVATALSGCATIDPVALVRMQRPLPEASAEVLVYREPAFNAGGARMRFGAEGKNLLVLETSQYANLQLPPGEYRLFVQGPVGEPFIKKVEIKAKERKCVRGFPNPNNLLKALPLVDISFLFGQTFFLEEGACPTPEQLVSFSQIKVEYE